jgi:hypothetical protein
MNAKKILILSAVIAILSLSGCVATPYYGGAGYYRGAAYGYGYQPSFSINHRHPGGYTYYNNGHRYLHGGHKHFVGGQRYIGGGHRHSIGVHGHIGRGHKHFGGTHRGGSHRGHR